MAQKYIDVSRYQGKIDWAKVKGAGIKGAILKTVSTNYSQFGGLYIDPTFEYNYSECKRLGIPVGAYYYTYAQDKAYADKELALFKQAVTGKSFELPLVVDVEDNTLRKLSASALTDLVEYAIKTIESWGAYAMVYTYQNYKNTELDMARLAKYDLWLAYYTNSKPAGTYGIWQYSSKGKVAGITGNVDLNWAYKDYPTLIKGKFNDFTNGTVNNTIKPISSEPIPLKIGFISSGDANSVMDYMYEELGISTVYTDGYIYTPPISSGDQVNVITKVKEYGDIPVVEGVSPDSEKEHQDTLKDDKANNTNNDIKTNTDDISSSGSTILVEILKLIADFVIKLFTRK